MSHPSFTALVMAANRPGVANPVAALQGKTHKAQVTIAGRNMLSRVLDALRASRHVGRIVISVEDVASIKAVPEVAALMSAGLVTTVPSEGSLFRSLKRAMHDLGEEALPLVVVTSDIPLLTPEMLDDFCERMLAEKSDLAIGMSPTDLTLEKYPRYAEAGVAHEFRDGKFSTCNIYGVGAGNALKVAQVLETGGQFRKKRFRIIKAFGLMAFFIYIFKLRTFAGVMEHVSKRFGVKVSGIVMPYAEGSIDVDDERSFRLVQDILEAQDRAA